MTWDSVFKNFLTNLHRFFFKLLILFLPLQLGKHFWPEFSLLWGLRVDYLSPTVYLTDFLVLATLLSWVLETQWAAGRRQRAGIRELKHLNLILLSGIFLILNSFWAKSRGLAFYKLSKSVEFFLFALYVARNQETQKTICRILPITIIYNCLIAFGQLFKQSSLNGIFWWLGERTFTLGTPGIARAYLGNKVYLRPYGVFPHPNVLAGFLLVSLILAWNRKKNCRSWLLFFIAGPVLFFCFSRPVWLAGAIAGSFFLSKKFSKAGPVLIFLLLAGSLLFFFPARLSILRRLALSEAAVLMIKRNPIIGVGLGNFLVHLPDFWQAREIGRFWQPVHNLYFLIGAETGLAGLLGSCFFLWRSLAKIVKEKRVLISLLAILFTGLFDHYWLTLQQGQLVFALVLGLVWQRRA
ncbi:MAG: O-antigen ligase family protein [Candidatus Pacebacteria bacterium]|nr:O-antigen ligase family protein [Candidatus Paceibacterota bacterium]